MADHRALTLQGGTTTRQQDADNLIVGAGAKTSAGELSVDGFTGVALKGAGTAAVKVNATGTALTMQAGATLATTGTGNINLPNNGAAKFNIEGVAVSAAVTTANLGTLTAGVASNADGLHTHASVTASQVVESGLTTAGLAVGDFGYASATNTMTKTDADAMASSRCVGANEGTVGSMTVMGVIEAAKFTTAGGAPSPGAPVYLAPGTEEASAAGKLTATAPVGAGQVVAEVGLCLDATAYAGAKTSSVTLQIKTPIQL